MTDRRTEIARQHNIPDEYHDLLAGDTDEALNQQAQRLIRLLTPSEPQVPQHLPIAGQGVTNDMSAKQAFEVEYQQFYARN